MTKYVSCIYDSLLGVWNTSQAEFIHILGEYINVCLCVFQETKTTRILNINVEADSRNYTSVEKGFDKYIMPHAIIMQLINKTDTQDLICFSNNMEVIFLKERKQKGELVYETHLFNACTNNM